MHMYVYTHTYTFFKHILCWQNPPLGFENSQDSQSQLGTEVTTQNPCGANLKVILSGRAMESQWRRLADLSLTQHCAGWLQGGEDAEDALSFQYCSVLQWL